MCPSQPIPASPLSPSHQILFYPQPPKQELHSPLSSRTQSRAQSPMRSIFRRKADERTPIMSNVEYMTAEEVAEYIRTTTRTVIIDVREDDHAGGHIKGSHHIPAPVLRTQPSRYLHLAKNADRIIFHCMFSQCRGPTCASVFQAALAGSVDGDNPSEMPLPKVCVLAGGFEAFAKLAVAGNLDLVEHLDRVLYV